MKKIVFIAVLIISQAAFGQSGDASSVLRCSAITDSVKRLACFDAIAAKEQSAANHKAAATLNASNTSGNSAWTTDIEQSKIDDSTTVTLSARAEDALAGDFGETSYPVLVLRCLRNETNVYITFGDMMMADIEGYGDVTFRVDKHKAFTRSLAVSTDNKSLGFWYGRQAIAFIKKLFGGSALLIRATPFDKSAVLFTIPISGTKEAIKPLRQACRW